MLGFFKTGTRKEIAVSVLWIALLGALTFLFNLNWNPRITGLKPDSSLFAYGGQMVTEGKLLYRDFWDHKPPAVFYLDALAIRLMGTSLWAFWWGNVVWVALSSTALFLVLRKITGTLSAMLSSGVFLAALMYPTIFSGGNLTEMYATLPLILIIGSAFLYFRSGHWGWAFAVGFLTAAAFLFKQTCIALGIGAALAILVVHFRTRQYRKGLIHLAWLAAGALLPLGAVALVWVHEGAFGDLWDAVFAFNVNYVGSGISSATFSVMARILLLEFPLMPLSLAVLAALGIFLVRNRPWLFTLRAASPGAPFPAQAPAREQTFLAVFMALPFEIALIALGGRNFPHYYMAVLPVFTAAIAYLIEALTRPIWTWQDMNILAAIALVLLAVAGLIWIKDAYHVEKPQAGLRLALAGPFFGPLPQSDLAKYILSHTRADDAVLLWADNKSMNFLTGRRSPSRYLYPEHLFQPKSGPVSRFDQFLQDLHRDPPALILVPSTPNPSAPFINAPDDALCPGCIPAAAEGMQLFKAFVNANYRPVAPFGSYMVYVRIP
jgi:4-amino-4-deoxy-L-arabinose transferase-like glycosyltransferase